MGQHFRPAGVSAWGCEAILSPALDLRPLPGSSLSSSRRLPPVSRPAQCPLRVQTALPALNTRPGRSWGRDSEEPRSINETLEELRQIQALKSHGEVLLVCAIYVVLVKSDHHSR